MPLKHQILKNDPVNGVKHYMERMVHSFKTFKNKES